MRARLAALLLSLAATTAQADWLYIGTQNDELRLLPFDAGSGALGTARVAAAGLRPTWTVVHPQLPVLYAVDDQPGKEGRVAAFALNRASGALSKLNDVASGGAGATHLWLDAPSRTLLVANFGGGSASSIAVQPDGSLGALVSTIQASGSGPHRRQASAHAHSTAVDPSGRYALVPDLGADRVFVYPLERASHQLAADQAGRAWTAPPGSGPRHLAFGAAGRQVYLLNELSAEVVVLDWDAAAGRLAPRQTLATSSSGFAGPRSGAEVLAGADGRFLYVLDRGERALVVYRIDPASGMLTWVQRLPSGGDVPWAMAIHPSGRWLLVAHQRSGTVNVFGIDAASGLLHHTGASAEVPAAVSISVVSEAR